MNTSQFLKSLGFKTWGHDNLKASSSYIGIPFPDLAQNVSWANSRFLVERLLQNNQNHNLKLRRSQYDNIVCY
jgi:hypothetical protein